MAILANQATSIIPLYGANLCLLPPVLIRSFELYADLP